ncbi:YceI family protein [Simiduia curdlanivorans]|uniref:YceI family protein n=1 Tax=Simiduia curdlanivorans TaxID=1492769 RepID=A0ABV8V8N2_9GAMM|nr:YceI family protein [Simiduia curdlanivorans]MDN3639396.1 YceI family protein [Simiduia curdlanivorans]
MKTKTLKHLLLLTAALTLTTSSTWAAPNQAPEATKPFITEAPAGAYGIDPSHADLSFRVNHLGFSAYTARFTSFSAQLQFDPANPNAMSVTATIDPRSLALPAPPEGFLDTLLSPAWLDAAQFRQITFRSTHVEATQTNTVRISGDLTLHGVTKPVILNATFNGGYAGHPFDPNARIGFSARGNFNRSDFGLTMGIPAPGSTMGVGDTIDVIIEAEFTGPPLKTVQ